MMTLFMFRASWVMRRSPLRAASARARSSRSRASPDVEGAAAGAPVRGGKQHHGAFDLAVDLAPRLEEESRPEDAAPADSRDDGSHHAGAPFEILALEQGIDEGAFSGFDGADHGDPQ